MDEKKLHALKKLISNMDEKKLHALLISIETLHTLADKALIKEDILKIIEALVKVVKDTKETNIKEFKLIHETIKILSDKLRADNSQDIIDIKNSVKNALQRQINAIETMLMTATEKMKQVDEKMAMVKDGKPADETRITNDILGRLPSPPFLEPKVIRDKLENLKEEDEKLKIDAIGYLKEKLEELEKKIVQKSGGHAIFASQRGAVKVYDASPQLNGVLKTFSLPAFWRVLVIHLSSVPNSAARENIDWTSDAGASTITFTSEINAASTLAAGQSLLVEYAEP